MEMLVSEHVLRDIIKSELVASNHICRFPVTDEQAKQIGSIIDELSSNTNGSVSAVFREMEANHIWLTKQRNRGEKLSMVFFVTIFTGFIGGVGTACWLGLKKMLQE